MTERLTILKKKLDLQINNAMATLMEMQEEATKLSQADVSTSASDILSDDEIATLIAKQDRTRYRRHNKSKT